MNDEPSRYDRQADVPARFDPAWLDGCLHPVEGKDGRAAAYLSTPAVQNHAAFLERLPGGDLGLVWFGGTQEGVSDIGIWFSRLSAGSDRWTDAIAVSDDPTRSEQNPVLFSAPGGEVWLLYTAQSAGNQDTAEVRRRISTDGARTWGEAETLFPATEEGGIFIRQPLVVTRSGRWLLPVFHCVSRPGSAWDGGLDTSAVMISDDHGVHWREVAVPDSTGCVHMSIVERPDGSLHALFRSRRADAIHWSESFDDGETWTVPEATELPNNNSSLQHRTLADGRLIVVYNHSSRRDARGRRESLYDEIDEGGIRDVILPPSTDAAAAQTRLAPGEPFWGAPRAPLSVAVSSDGGRTFRVVGDLEQGDGYCLSNNSRDGVNREFSYPVLLPAPDGSVDVAYTYFRRAIKHVRLAATWVRADA
ncbi:exo-alpha-sialidase [Microbacterium sp. NPDC089189]|uniref:sialidase family protein n=1 Tax=Microbacterium sp. NPDC089189 TaxID=3154972 RepID=UPI00343B7C8F